MFNRIVSDPAILGGKPIMKGTRISGDSAVFEATANWIMEHPREDALQVLFNLDRKRAHTKASI